MLAKISCGAASFLAHSFSVKYMNWLGHGVTMHRFKILIYGNKLSPQNQYRVTEGASNIFSVVRYSTHLQDSMSGLVWNRNPARTFWLSLFIKCKRVICEITFQDWRNAGGMCESVVIFGCGLRRLYN